jgi:DNA-binding NarL/FixJ family response regulator
MEWVLRMAEMGRLAGLSVLVLEDDYFLADDSRNVLTDTGAAVVGPFWDAAEAIAAADRSKPDCAIVDVNLGRGPNFAPARALVARGVPVLFITGYDGDAIPEDLRDAPSLQKPAHKDRIVEAVATLCGRLGPGGGARQTSLNRQLAAPVGLRPSHP